MIERNVHAQINQMVILFFSSSANYVFMIHVLLVLVWSRFLFGSRKSQMRQKLCGDNVLKPVPLFFLSLSLLESIGWI